MTLSLVSRPLDCTAHLIQTQHLASERNNEFQRCDLMSSSHLGLCTLTLTRIVFSCHNVPRVHLVTIGAPLPDVSTRGQPRLMAQTWRNPDQEPLTGAGEGSRHRAPSYVIQSAERRHWRTLRCYSYNTMTIPVSLEENWPGFSK